jgi:hypothetical protein
MRSMFQNLSSKFFSPKIEAPVAFAGKAWATSAIGGYLYYNLRPQVVSRALATACIPGGYSEELAALRGFRG